jgi:hypothetical protein
VGRRGRVLLVAGKPGRAREVAVTYGQLEEAPLTQRRYWAVISPVGRRIERLEVWAASLEDADAKTLHIAAARGTLHYRVTT